MAARLRRRVHHGDVGGKKYERLDSSSSDGLGEPLLANEYDPEPSTDYDWDDKKRNEDVAWTHIFSSLIMQWTQWLSAVFFGGIMHRVLHRRHDDGFKADPDFALTPIQETRLRKIQERLEVPFDGNNADHREALAALWRVAFPGRELNGLVSEQWKDMGWQGTDPSTDFRGGGFISLENLLFFAQHYPKSFSRLLMKEEGRRSHWEYPFAVAGINVSFMLIQMLDLRADKPSSTSGYNFLRMLVEDESAFDTLYCVAFEMMDAQWLAMRASYMEFNAVLKATRLQLERELSLDDVQRVQDLPAYNLLCR